MRKFIISAPFGNYITHSKCTSVCGTYTLHKRGTLLTRLYRSAKTIRPLKNGWVNNLGLQNPGIRSVKVFSPQKIYSITAIRKEEWDKLINFIPEEISVELNLSCPNLDQKIEIEKSQVADFLNKFPMVIFKLSPTIEIYDRIDEMVSTGANYLHIANTIPTDRGGESGERLKKLSLEIIRNVRKKYHAVKIIGGGGIYTPEDVELYVSAGADYFSLATVWFKPWQAIKLLRKY